PPRPRHRAPFSYFWIAAAAALCHSGCAYSVPPLTIIPPCIYAGWGSHGAGKSAAPGLILGPQRPCFPRRSFRAAPVIIRPHSEITLAAHRPDITLTLILEISAGHDHNSGLRTSQETPSLLT